LCCANGNSQGNWKTERRKDMRRIFTFVFILMVLTACSAHQTQVVTVNPATDMPQAGMPNPASVYCEQNGNKLENHTDDDGGQSGICVFPDGSTCDEWAFFRGECGVAATVTPKPIATADETANASGGYMPPGTSEAISDWWGSSRVRRPAHSMMTILSGRTWGRNLSILASIQWTRLYKRRSSRYATAARLFIFMAHLLVMCLITTALRFRWIASRLKGNDPSLIAVGFEKECPDLGWDTL
jgi:putative hemolysin